MIDTLISFVTLVTGPAIALGLCLMLLTSSRYHDAPLMLRGGLACVAAGLLLQTVIHLDPEEFAQWWIFKDIGIQSVGGVLLWRAWRHA